jgi:hypothetical protein
VCFATLFYRVYDAVSMPLYFRTSKKIRPKINRNNKMEIVKLMGENNGKWGNIYLTHFCNEYENR